MRGQLGGAFQLALIDAIGHRAMHANSVAREFKRLFEAIAKLTVKEAAGTLRQVVRQFQTSPAAPRQEGAAPARRGDGFSGISLGAAELTFSHVGGLCRNDSGQERRTAANPWQPHAQLSPPPLSRCYNAAPGGAIQREDVLRQRRPPAREATVALTATLPPISGGRAGGRVARVLHGLAWTVARTRGHRTPPTRPFARIRRNSQAFAAP